MTAFGRRRYKELMELKELEESAAILDIESARAHSLLQDLVHISGLDRLTCDVTAARGLVHDLEELHDRGTRFAIDYELNAVLSCALERARDLANDIASGVVTVDGDTITVLSSEIATALGFVGHSATWADGIRANNAARRAQLANRQVRRRHMKVASLAAHLVTAAARLLPAADRNRYAEEFQSELWDLAQARAGRLRQLQYALHQLLCAFPMGFALRSPRRKGATP